MKVLHLALPLEMADAFPIRTDGVAVAPIEFRDWVVHAFQSIKSVEAKPTLFSRPIAVEDEVPALLQALSRGTGRSEDELFETWLQERNSQQNTVALPRKGNSGSTSAESAELIDLVQTLFEEAVADAQDRLGNYPQGQAALESASQIFATLRRVLGLSEPV